jgi:hypothetical protein
MGCKHRPATVGRLRQGNGPDHRQREEAEHGEGAHNGAVAKGDQDGKPGDGNGANRLHHEPWGLIEEIGSYPGFRQPLTDAVKCQGERRLATV